ncbi:helix-turn-helix transcriptional regulator [Streptomyces sp. RB6PN25]|uniref:Helix-turn-helix transcriptional regulator n=1 Tax=Streptomyces humicola TaxID=2953240 RepID=A0ABT1PRJ2_9ACTN|nr:helix-turn-helix transcriptional regulator [Streptomyces humicola]MCQ4079748.1 helix-turn-helix transcriptional regulator [Streptomyces humicola]
MDAPTELGDFLRSRRARLQPEDAGLPAYGGRRRVPGLRREELAQLAGMSLTYYTRLEQGQSTNASEAVLDALARALQLSEDEHAHLRNLAHPARRPRRTAPRAEYARPGMQQLISAVEGVPALVVDRRSDVLAWNPLAHALLAGHLALDSPDRPSERPNLPQMLFLDPHTRELFTDWDEEARRTVASLRLVAGRFPDDRRLASLIGELSMKSSEFAALWSRHPVHNCLSGVKQFHHPIVGSMELSFEVMHVPDESGHRALMYSAEPGSPSEAALGLLAAEISNRRLSENTSSYDSERHTGLSL